MAERCILLDEILASPDQRFSRVEPGLVDTRSNLNSEVLADICLVCGLDSSTFSDSSSFIDIFLLKRRNSIAHGEEMFVDASDLEFLTSQTVTLMRAFGDAVENQIALEKYKR